MRYISKIFVCLLIVFLVVACGEKSQKVYLEKDGNLYEVTDQASFYYPKNFEMSFEDENKKILQFCNDQEVLGYSMSQDDTDNKIADMPKLYAGQLEEDGAQDVSIYSLKLDNGMECYECTGMYTSTGLMFKHIVYFTNNACYVYFYQAPKDIYNENIAVITQYLNSLTVHHE